MRRIRQTPTILACFVTIGFAEPVGWSMLSAHGSDRLDVLPVGGMQRAATCGWSFIDPLEIPPTLDSLRRRANGSPDWLPEAEAGLLRWYRDCDASAARIAALSLRRLQERSNSSDPLLLAWLGVALVRGPEVQVPGSVGAFIRAVHHRSNSERDGARLLARVMETVDWPEVAEELAAVAVATREDGTLDLASRALRNAAERIDEPAVWSALAEVELVRGDHDAAHRAAWHAIDAGAPRGMRVEGILQMRSGHDLAGAEVYLRGLALAVDQADVRPYFDDIWLLLGPDEREQWLGLEHGRSEWIRQKWEWRAGMAGVRLHERLAVNQRRLGEALTRYNRLSFRGASGFDLEMATDTVWAAPLDDRGQIYVRHGRPLTVIDDPVLPRGHRGDRVAWIYAGPTTKRVVLEFARPANSPDFVMTGPVACIPPRPAIPIRPMDPSMPRRGHLPPGPPSPYASTLATFEPHLGWYYIRCQWNRETAIMGYAYARETSREMAKTAWSTESGIIDFDQPLKTAWNLYAFDGPDGPELVSYLAIQTSDVQPEAETGRLEFDVLLSVGDPLTGTFTQLDTILRYTPVDPLPEDATLHWALPIAVSPNENARVNLTVRNNVDATQGRTGPTTWRIPTFDGQMLLSDIIVADTQNGVLNRGSHRLAPLIGHAVREGERFRLYYELYGVRSGDPLSVKTEFVPGKDESIFAKLKSLFSSRQALSVEFDEQADPDADGVVRIERDYDAALEPGAYAVLLTIRDPATGIDVTRETSLIVTAR